MFKMEASLAMIGKESVANGASLEKYCAIVEAIQDNLAIQHKFHKQTDTGRHEV